MEDPMNRPDYKKLCENHRKAKALWETLDSLDSMRGYLLRRWKDGIREDQVVRISLSVEGDNYTRQGHCSVPAAFVGKQFMEALAEMRKIVRTGIEAWELKP
jgi:hypothetical protein